MTIGTGLFLGCIVIGICILVAGTKISNAKYYEENRKHYRWQQTNWK